MSGEETRARFLAAIGAQLPVERVQEVHLFAPIRQGGMESGVAVIAVDLAAPVTAVESGAPAEPNLGADANLDADANVDVADNVGAGAHVDADEDTEADADAESDAVAGAREAEEPVDAEDATEFLADIAATAEPEVAAPPARATRYTVYTARYRHTLKGPDRGKWEISVTEEADAPLLTVDAVVRGVTRRSGEADETVRLSGDEFRAALPQPAAR